MKLLNHGVPANHDLSRRRMKILATLAVVACCSACGGSSPSGGGPRGGGGIALSLSAGAAMAPQEGTPAVVNATIARSGGDASPVSLAVSGLPSGASASFTQPGTGTSGSVSLTAGAGVAAGNYNLTVTASDGSVTSTARLALTVAIVAVVGSAPDPTLGLNGKLSQFMATSFQPASWDYTFFQQHKDTTTLNNLGSHHIRLQDLSVPMKASSNPPQAGDWDFTEIDAVIQPVLGVTDHSPEYQIAVAPDLPGMLNANGQLIVNPANLSTFAAYCANLVRYYNTGGFDWGGKHFQSASSNPIIWWGIFNEYNINGLTPSEYVELYNTVVPAMLAVDSRLQISALELSDFDYQEGDPRNNLPTFVAPAGSGGVSAPVNVASTHFYSSCNQTDSDTQIFSTVPGFVQDIEYFYQELRSRPDLAGVPVWVTENNVNADYSDGSGNSTCNPGQKFVTDQRGTSAFFAAWRPYVFSQLGKAGNQALYHWDYDADAQYGEVDFNTGTKYLSYWVDYWLGAMFPPAPAPDILQLNATETTTVELLATRSSDGSVVIMVADRAVHSPADNNGPGDPRTVIVDVSALGTLSSAEQLTLDANTDATNGPGMPVSASVAPKFTVSLGGYGVTFLVLKP